ncbi:hypothetical protein MASR1M32_24600 [Rhodobacter sp.]
MALDTDRLALEGRAGDELLDARIFADAEAPVRDLWSAGRRLVSGGVMRRATPSRRGSAG